MAPPRSRRPAPCCARTCAPPVRSSALADADFSVEAEPPWSPWRDQALGIRGEALLLVGDAEEARGAFEDAAAAGIADSDAYVVSESAARPAGHGPRRLGRRERPRPERARRHRRAPDGGLLHERAGVRRGRAAGGAPGRPAGGAARSSPGPCGPGRRARSPRPRSPFVCGSSSRRCTWPWPTTSTVRHLLREIDDVLRHRPDARRARGRGGGVPGLGDQRPGRTPSAPPRSRRPSSGCSRTCRRT